MRDPRSTEPDCEAVRTPGTRDCEEQVTLRKRAAVSAASLSKDHRAENGGSTWLPRNATACDHCAAQEPRKPWPLGTVVLKGRKDPRQRRAASGLVLPRSLPR